MAKIYIVALSGCSSSGKSTLARHLCRLFPRSFILHEDDFYKPEKDIPVKDGFQDWDCEESIDIPALENALQYIRDHGALPPSVRSLEDESLAPPCPLSADVLEAARARVATLAPSVVVCFVDGFLLYTPRFARPLALVDARLFLPVSRDTAIARRQSRNGYATLEGFWQDPPHYVERIVWPNYEQAHARFFASPEDARAGNVDVERVRQEEGVETLGQGSTSSSMDVFFQEAVDLVLRMTS